MAKKQSFREFVREIILESSLESIRLRKRLDDETANQSLQDSYDYLKWRTETGQEMTPDQVRSLEWLAFKLKKEQVNKKQMN